MKIKQFVESLIEMKKEGDYWDFKKVHHSNVVDLVKDIVCLANVISQNDRYIIFGVNNNYEVTGISGTENRRTQSDIVCCLRDSKFANGLFPDIYLHYVDELDVDVLIIKNKKEKPYYLDMDKSSNGKILRCGVIYSRTRDTNTPNNGTSSYFEIQKMWKERFGIDQTPIDRMEEMITKPEEWISNIGNVSHGYNTKAPEYNYEIIQKGKIDDCINYFFPNTTTFKEEIIFKYHSTTLFEMVFIGADEYREVIPYPDIEVIDDKLLYYYYNLESRNGKLLLFFIGLNKNSYRMRQIPPLIIFKDEIEKKSFDCYLHEKLIDILEADNSDWDHIETPLKDQIILYDKSWKAYMEWKGT